MAVVADQGFAHDLLLASPVAGLAHARVICQGRLEAERRGAAHELFFEGVERWTVQFWLQ